MSLFKFIRTKMFGSRYALALLVQYPVPEFKWSFKCPFLQISRLKMFSSCLALALFVQWYMLKMSLFKFIRSARASRSHYWFIDIMFLNSNGAWNAIIFRSVDQNLSARASRSHFKEFFFKKGVGPITSISFVMNTFSKKKSGLQLPFFHVIMK